MSKKKSSMCYSIAFISCANIAVISCANIAVNAWDHTRTNRAAKMDSLTIYKGLNLRQAFPSLKAQARTSKPVIRNIMFEAKAENIPGVTGTTSKRLSSVTKGDSLSNRESGCPMPPAAPTTATLQGLSPKMRRPVALTGEVTTSTRPPRTMVKLTC